MSIVATSSPVGTVVVRIDPNVQCQVQSGDQLQLLQAATHAALDMIALVGENALAVFDALQRDYDKLLLLEKAGISLDEASSTQLQLHRDLRTRTTVLPGFMVTSQDHIMLSAIFDANNNINSIQAIMQHLGVHTATTPLTLNAQSICALIHAANGLAIAHPQSAEQQAHVLQLINDGHLHAVDRALDVPQQPVCVLGGSGATTLDHIGTAFTEVHATELSFAALRDTIMNRNANATRFVDTPIRRWAIDQLIQATDSNDIIHTNDTKPTDLIPHLAALANLGGGILLLGVVAGAVIGVKQKDKVISNVAKATESVDPAVDCSYEEIQHDDAVIIRVEVRATNPPHLHSDGRVYVRRAAQTVPATAAELHQLIRNTSGNGADLDLPRSGVSIVSAQRRAGIWHYEVRDLRTTAGVTRDRAQGLWDYAIERHEALHNGEADIEAIQWMGQIGLWRAYVQGGRPKYDLVHRDSHGVIDHIFYGVSDWGLSTQWQQVINTYAPQVGVDTISFDEDAAATTASPASITATSLPTQPSYQTIQGETRPRWRGRGAITRIWRDDEQKPHFDLLLKNKVMNDGTESVEIQEYHGVTRDQLNQAWLDLVQVKKPRTGIEVVEVLHDDNGDKRFIFRNLRNDEISPHPWRMNDIEEGSIRQYAARMHLADQELNEDHIRWWGNIGYMRPMRRQVDLIYRDENGVDHIFYAARRDELVGEWNDLLAEYDDVVE